MIGGFIITGNASKPVILRGIGPSLISAGVPAASVLNDPVLELHGPNGSLITKNDDWKDSPQRAQIEGTMFQPTDDREAVIMTTLPPGAYTAILAGSGQTTGIGLVEIYDRDPAVDSALGNISTRGFVQSGNDVLIGGFSLGNNPTNTRIVVRGLGPSLAQSGLSNVLEDPTLELHDANGAPVVSNDNWTDDPASASQLFANGLAYSRFTISSNGCLSLLVNDLSADQVMAHTAVRIVDAGISIVLERMKSARSSITTTRKL
jgi:hypothetical protein